MKILRYRLGGLLTGLLAIFLLASTPAPAEEGAAFLSDIPDLPLMEGLREISDSGLVFDKPSGRIVEARAEGDLEESEVRRFYENTLGQLGWTAAGQDRFQRENEILTISYEQRGERLLVGFSLHPE